MTLANQSILNISLETRQALERTVKLFRWSSLVSGFIFVIPIWVLFERGFLSFGQMALLEAAATVLTLGLELPTGALADILGRKFSAGLGWVFQGVGYIFQGTSHEPIQFSIGFGLNAIGVALVSGADSALLYDTLKELGRPEDFKKELSTCGLWQQVAIGFSALTGGWLYQIWTGLPYILYAAGMLMAAGMFALMKEPDIDSQKFSLAVYIHQLKQGVKEVTATPWARLVGLLYIFVGGITWSGQLFFNNTFAVELGFTPIQLGWLFGSIRILNAFLLFKVLHLEKIVKASQVAIFFPILMLFAYLPGVWAHGWWAYPFLMAAVLASSARHIILAQYCHDEYSSKNRATAMSTLNMAVSILYGCFMLVGGWVLEHGSARMMYVGMGVVTLLTVVPVAIKIVAAQPKAKTDS